MPSLILLAQAPAATPALRDIAGPVMPTFLESMDRTDWLLLGGGILLTLAAFWFAWRLFVRRPPAPPPPPPDPRGVARSRLEALRARVEALSARDFGAECADVLRHFIRSRYGVSTIRRTSEEFLQAMAGERIFSEREGALLQRFLTQCDLLKFADLATGPAEAVQLIEDALSFVEGSAPTVIRPAALTH